MRKANLLISIAMLWSIGLFAQFSISGQFRTKGECLHGYKKLAAIESTPSIMLSQRSRIILNYKNVKYSTRFSFQDIRLWGDEDNYTGAAVIGKATNSLDISEAWFETNLSQKISLRLGRQILSYDDARLISWRNWLQSNMSYDAVLLKYKNDKNWDIHLATSWNNYKTNLYGNDYYTDRMKTMSFLYIKKIFTDKLYLSATAIASGYQKAGTVGTIYLMGTEGLHLNFNNDENSEKGVFGIANAFIQNGNNKTGQDVNAFMITAEAGYHTNELGWSVSAGTEILSGNNADNTDTDYINTDHSFDLLYGGRFPYYGGNTNLITVNDKNLAGGGLVDFYLKISHKLTKKSIISTKIFYNQLQNNILAANDNNKTYYDKSLGYTIDLNYLYKFSKDVKLKFGFSYALPSDTFIRMQNITDNNGDFKTGNNYFGWVMLIVSPKFLN